MATPEAIRPTNTYRGAGLSKIAGGFSWFWVFSKRQPLGGLGLVIIVLLGVMAIFGPWLTPMDPLKIHSRNSFENPHWWGQFALGSDHLGRDNLSRLIIGARVSLTIAVASVLLGSSIGFVIGLTGGYYGGRVDAVTQRLLDVIMAFPTIVLALAIISVLGREQTNVILAISLVQIPATARVVRSVVLSTRTMEFVTAARALGASDPRLLIRHVSPHTFAPVMILITAALGLAILIESSLAFLGLGTAPPNPTWGSMLSGPTLTNIQRAPWNAFFPGFFLTMAVFSFNLLGDALRDVLDPRLRR